ncbi:Protein of unknown function DUF247 [Panicum miliaceum]|uniref:Uncharacterized protein n=1 Tax=Panicum miliaceum TaxID=4540 RepID=A0A3L6SJ32_PANMI|nr:Protein of unknown function DUF247 [Panicum miliaceum]
MASVTSLEASVEATLSTLREQAQKQPFTIFRVPAYIRESSRAAYEPRMVSIGPYYNGAAAPRSMEDHKWRFLDDLLSRNPGISSSVLIQEMRSLEARARACYSERPALDSDDFIRMLLLDGCFILEFLFKWHTKELDATSDVGWGLTLITVDLFLLDNQVPVPFFVVEKLYDVVAGVRGSRDLLVNLFLEYTSDDKTITRPSRDSEIHHLLHLYYDSFVPKLSPEVEFSWAKNTVVIPPATALSDIGVTFVVNRAPARDRFVVKFDGSRGVMEMPLLEIDNIKAPIIGKLMAFEQTRRDVNVGVLTSFLRLMSMLVPTAEDVALLRRNSIWGNEVARFFNHLGESALTKYDWVFSGLCREVDQYCNSWRRKNCAALKRTELMTIYFRSPWSIISVVAAALVILLTARGGGLSMARYDARHP